MKIPMIGGSYTGRSSSVSPERCINLYFDPASHAEGALVGTPGCTQFADCSAHGGEVRGIIAYGQNVVYAVVGSKFLEISSTGTVTSRGTLNTSSGRVSMAHNGPGVGNEIMVVDGSQGWIYSSTGGTFTQILDADFTSTDRVDFIDGYFIYAEKGSGRFWITNLYAGGTIDGLDFATAEGGPDRLMTVLCDKRQVWLFGEDTSEVWYNSGDANNTFQRFQGGFTHHGCVATFSPQLFDNTVVWLTRNNRGQCLVAQAGQGYAPKIISSPEMAYQIQQYSTVSDAWAYTYQLEGHEFYVLNFPTAKAVWAYDAATQIWHERAHIISNVFPNRERYNCHAFACGKHLLGDMSNGLIYQLSNSVYTMNGGVIPRVRQIGNISDEERRIRLKSVQIDLEEGVGLTDSTDTDAYLSWSKDGGHTWSNEIKKSIGKIGEYTLRAVWRKLGEGRIWAFRLKIYGPIKVVIKGMIARQYGEP